MHVGQPHDGRGRPALDEAGDEAEQTAHDRRHHHRADADEQREPRAVEDAREQIAAELVGAKQMARRARGLETAGEVGGHRVGCRQPGRADGGDDDGQGERQAEVFLHDRSLTRGSSQA